MTNRPESTMTPAEFATEIRRLMLDAKRDDAIAEALAAECRAKFGPLTDDHASPEPGVSER